MNIRTGALVAVAVAALIALSGCSDQGSPSASTTPSPTSSSVSPAPTPAPSPTSSEPAAALTIYYVAIGSNGADGPGIGCGDSIVATQTAPVHVTDTVAASMRALLAPSPRVRGSGLVNVLSQSHLASIDSTVSGSTVTIYLTGAFQLSGMCDIPRAKAQLEYTAKTAAGARNVVIYVNGKTLDEVLSLK